MTACLGPLRLRPASLRRGRSWHSAQDSWPFDPTQTSPSATQRPRLTIPTRAAHPPAQRRLQRVGRDRQYCGRRHKESSLRADDHHARPSPEPFSPRQGRRDLSLYRPQIAGVAKASPYHHFRSKDHLVAEILRPCDQRWRTWLEDSVRSTTDDPEGADPGRLRRAGGMVRFGRLPSLRLHQPRRRVPGPEPHCPCGRSRTQASGAETTCTTWQPGRVREIRLSSQAGCSFSWRARS